MATKRALIKRWTEPPGKEIEDKVNDFLRSLRNPGHGRHADEMLQILKGLPYQEEVPGGRDLRGAALANITQLDLREWDLSFLQSCGHFFDCNLAGVRFDEARIPGVGVRSNLTGASFRKAALKGVFFSDTIARRAVFDGAKLTDASFQSSDLAGASFRNADCKGANFVGANLIGCDFRGAKLEEVVFQSATLDGTTDFRGASLKNAYYKDHFDNSGRLIGRGVDLRKAMHDETTTFGDDPAALDLEVVHAAIVVALEEGAVKVVERLRNIEVILKKGPLPDWESEAIKGLSEADLRVFEEILDEAYRSLR